MNARHVGHNARRDRRICELLVCIPRRVMCDGELTDDEPDGAEEHDEGHEEQTHDDEEPAACSGERHVLTCARMRTGNKYKRALNSGIFFYPLWVTFKWKLNPPQEVAAQSMNRFRIRPRIPQ